MSRQLLGAAALVSLTIAVGVAAAQEAPRRRGTRPPTPAPAAPAKPETKAEPAKEPPLAETTHTVTIGGTRVDYKATAGRLELKNDESKTTAHVFFVAYTRTGAEEAGKRPLTFAFNGGPGSSAVWLQMGALGPRRVGSGDVGSHTAPPYPLVDNEHSILDITDLVFIDPVSTGYSRAAEGEKAAQFHGVQQDLDSVSEFIRMYTTRFNRWASPKFLIGESYGTTRASGLSGLLQDRHGLYLNGIALVSAVLNFETISFAEGNDLPYSLFLPTYTATAWYHKKLPAELQGDLDKALAEARKFAAGEYTLALMRGEKLSAAERKEVVRKLARYTGLSEEFIDRSDLRVPIFRFTKELLRSEKKTVGRYDSRMTGSDVDPVSDRMDYDPSYTIVQGAYTAAFNQYVRNELKYESEMPYEILTSKVRPWDYGTAGQNRYVNVAETLRQAMIKNHDLRVFVANGYYDLATPFFATEYTFDHMALEPPLAGHVTLAYYEGGHMMYLHPPALAKLKKDLSAFIEAAVKR